MIITEMKKVNKGIEKIIEGLNKIVGKMIIVTNIAIILFLDLNLNLNTQLQRSKL